MKPKLAIVGHPLLTRPFEELIRKKGIEESATYFETVFEELPGVVAKLEQNKDLDVIVTGWGYSKFFKGESTPVMAINVTGFDILDALTKAKRMSSRVVFMRYGEPFDIERYSETLGMEIISSFHLDREDTKQRIKVFLERGYDTFIGTSLMCDVATELGGKAIYVYSRDSIANALEHAWQLAVSRRVEIRQRERFRVILEHAREGIIALDERLVCILVNSEAETLLGCQRSTLLAKPIADTLPVSKVHDCLEKAEPLFSMVEKINGKRLLVDYIPHYIHGQISGLVLTLRDFQTVQDAEWVVRQNLYHRGHAARYRFADIIGSSPVLTSTVNLAQMFAKSDSTVLITGESGTGKELFAQSIHADSKRNNKPFIALNCAALTESLLESELFGYEEGAFTGAKKGGKPGLFELAHEGTLYLDEVGELSVDMQSRLLRVLQERQIRRVGGSHWFHVDVRIIAATNRDLKKMVLAGEFRADLYYRLNVLRLFVPALRERPEDIPELVRTFCKQGLEPERAEFVIEVIARQSAGYTWPGNIRELENITQRLLVARQWQMGNEPQALVQMVFSDLTIPQQRGVWPQAEARHEAVLRLEREGVITKETLHWQKTQSEKELILKVLEQCQGNRSKAAESLGMSRSTLWKKLKC